MNHFYFQFNPVEDYSINVIFFSFFVRVPLFIFCFLKTILFWFPYLCGMIEDELIHADLFRAISLRKQIFDINKSDIELFKIPLKLSSKETHFQKCQIGIWKFTGLFIFKH
jgi:hypothetical protein